MIGSIAFSLLVLAGVVDQHAQYVSEPRLSLSFPTTLQIRNNSVAMIFDQIDAKEQNQFLSRQYWEARSGECTVSVTYELRPVPPAESLLVNVTKSISQLESQAKNVIVESKVEPRQVNGAAVVYSTYVRTDLNRKTQEFGFDGGVARTIVTVSHSLADAESAAVADRLTKSLKINAPFSSNEFSRREFNDADRVLRFTLPCVPSVFTNASQDEGPQTLHISASIPNQFNFSLFNFADPDAVVGTQTKMAETALAGLSELADSKITKVSIVTADWEGRVAAKLVAEFSRGGLVWSHEGYYVRNGAAVITFETSATSQAGGQSLVRNVMQSVAIKK